MTVIRISGPRACFANPLHTAELYSYDVPTVSALRQIIGSVYAKPEVRHVIRRIEVLNPIKRSHVVQNGVTVATNNTNAKVNQFVTSYLVDVDYRVYFDTQVLDGSNLGKHRLMFARRLERGAQYKQPYLGLRDMIAKVQFDYDNTPPIDQTEDLGLMLYDVVHPTKYHETQNLVRKFANLRMVNGVINTDNVDVRIM